MKKEIIIALALILIVAIPVVAVNRYINNRENQRYQESLQQSRLKLELDKWLQSYFKGEDFEFPQSFKIGECVFKQDVITPSYGDLYDYTRMETPKGSVMRYELSALECLDVISEEDILRESIIKYFSHHYTKIQDGVYMNPKNPNCIFFMDFSKSGNSLFFIPGVYIVKRNLMEKPGTYRARKEQAARNKADIQNSKPIIF